MFQQRTGSLYHGIEFHKPNLGPWNRKQAIVQPLGDGKGGFFDQKEQRQKKYTRPKGASVARRAAV